MKTLKQNDDFLPNQIHISIENSPEKQRFVVDKDCMVVIDNLHFTLPVGFHSDLASIPKIVNNIISRFEYWLVLPSILHDYLYQNGNSKNISRKRCDLILYKACLFNINRYKKNLSTFKILRLKLKAMAVHRAVRIFGDSHYNNKQIKMDL